MPRLVPPKSQAALRGSLNSAAIPDGQQRVEDYIERVSKYIPAEIITGFLAVRGIAPTYGSPGALPAVGEFIIYGLLVIFTPLYLMKVSSKFPQRKWQLVIATFSFVLWTYSIGGFFWTALEHALGCQIVYQGLAGAILVVWSLGIGLYIPKDESQ